MVDSRKGSGAADSPQCHVGLTVLILDIVAQLLLFILSMELWESRENEIVSYLLGKRAQFEVELGGLVIHDVRGCHENLA